MIKSWCDWCGKEKDNCSQFHDAMVCADCQHDWHQARETLKRAATVTLLNRMSRRATV